MKIILSIVIPVYNVEKYIGGCLDSVFCQMQDDGTIEIIIVNDGTPDKSMEIVEEFSKKFNNLIIVNQENKGLSGARNAGLRCASGAYVWFVDSDDQLHIDALSFLKDKLDNSKVDIIGFNLTGVYENDMKEFPMPIICSKDHSLYNVKVTNQDILGNAHIAPVQRFIFRRGFLEDRNLRFYEGIIHEDIEFMIRATFLATSIVLCNISLYRYLQRSSGSIMATLNMKSIECRNTILKSISEFKASNAKTLYDRSYLDYYIFRTLHLMLKYSNESLESKICNYVSSNAFFYRKIALNGIIANIYFRDFKKVLRCLLVLLSPIYAHKILSQKRK